MMRTNLKIGLLIACIFSLPACNTDNVSNGTQGLTEATNSDASAKIPEPSLAAPGNAPQEKPQVAFADNGNAIVVWRELDAGQYSIRAGHYDTNSGWDLNTIRLDNNGALGDTDKPQIDMSPDGHAIAVWQQVDDNGVLTSIWANHFTPGSGWSAALLLENLNNSRAELPQVAMDTNNNAIVTWRRYIEGQGVFNTTINRFHNNAWTGATDISFNMYDVMNPQVAMDDAGNGIVIWTEMNLGVRANRFNVNTQLWGADDLIGPGTATRYAQVAMDNTGNGMVVWRDSDGSVNNAWAARYDINSGWDSPLLIESGNGSVDEEIDVAMDSRGNAIAVWRQLIGTRYEVVANRYDINSGWGLEQSISSQLPAAGPVHTARVAMDDIGNAFVVWRQPLGTPEYDIWGQHFSITSNSWLNDPRQLESRPEDSYSPQISMSPDGDAMCVWYQGASGSTRVRHKLRQH